MTGVLETTIVLDPLQALSRDIREAATMLSRQEVRFLVDYYYQTQEDRKRGSNQVRSVEEAGEPHKVLDWLASNTNILEKNIAKALAAYSDAHPVGRWAESIVGIGPIISAGLLANIDIQKSPTVGHIWRFAGLDPTQKWGGKKVADAAVSAYRKENHSKSRRDAPTEKDAKLLALEMSGLNPDSVLQLATSDQKGDKKPLTWDSLSKALAVRPFNAGLKTLCWKIGESFVKVSNNPNDIYGHLYVERKEQEIARNEAGEFASQAADKLARQNIGKGTDAYKSYIEGKLPPAHIHARAKRWAVKLFLAHWHHVAYDIEYGTLPPKPYILTQEGHTHYVAPPHWNA